MLLQKLSFVVLYVKQMSLVEIIYIYIYIYIYILFINSAYQIIFFKWHCCTVYQFAMETFPVSVSTY